MTRRKQKNASVQKRTLMNKLSAVQSHKTVVI